MNIHAAAMWGGWSCDPLCRAAPRVTAVPYLERLTKTNTPQFPSTAPKSNKK